MAVAIALALATHSARASSACTPATVMSPLLGLGSLDTPSVSEDGRFMAFTDLVSGQVQVLVFDRLTCTTEMVSVNSQEVPGNGHSGAPSISGDGLFVAFQSDATNLGSALFPDFNGVSDVFVRDRVNGTTSNVARPLGTTWANGPASSPAFSSDGQSVAFLSAATDLVAGDTNGLVDVFVKDIFVSGSLTRVSVATGGVQGTGGPVVEAPAVSADGRYVAFASGMTNLVPGDTNSTRDVFRHDRQTSATIRVSIRSGGGQHAGLSGAPAISSDGRFVAFNSADGLVAGDTNGWFDVFVHDATLQVTARVSTGLGGSQPDGAGLSPSMSADGRFVAFESFADNLVVGDTNGATDVFVHDRQTSVTRRISTAADGIQGSDDDSSAASLSANGLFVAFNSFAANLVPGDPEPLEADAFITNWPAVSAPPNVNLMVNGDFSNGFAPWGTFALPHPGDIIWNTIGGVLKFWRDPGSTQAVVLQETGAQLPAYSPLTAQFDVWNSSGGRKRISVLLHDRDFSDLSVCTLWLDPFTPRRTYLMSTHTTKSWSSATISFYAATADGTPAYHVDDVSLFLNPGGSADSTTCVDPTSPVAPSGTTSGNLTVNGGFGTGLAPWGTFGQIVWQIGSGAFGPVFEFYRPAGAPAGVVFQATGQPMANDQIIISGLWLGNSSPVRKRVTVLLHDADFSDLAACTFWLPPATPLSPYFMATFATEAWTNAMVSIYGATIGTDQWIRLDEVELLRFANQPIVGTECLEPDFSRAAAPPAATASFGGAAPSRSHPRPMPGAAGDGLRPSRDASASGHAAVGDAVSWHAVAAPGSPAATLERPLDLREVIRAHLSFRSRLRGPDTRAEVQVSTDGVSWQSVTTVPATDDWTDVAVDLSDFTGQTVYVRLVLYAPSDGLSMSAWSVEDLRLETASGWPVVRQ